MQHNDFKVQRMKKPPKAKKSSIPVLQLKGKVKEPSVKQPKQPRM